MMITFINMVVKHNNLLKLIIGCLYVSFFGLHVSVILMTIIRSVPIKLVNNSLKYIVIFSFTFHLNSLFIVTHYLTLTVFCICCCIFSSYRPDDGHKNDQNM
jgi:hypothetical protein